VDGEPVVFLSVTPKSCTESFLEDINNMLNSGQQRLPCHVAVSCECRLASTLANASADI